MNDNDKDHLDPNDSDEHPIPLDELEEVQQSEPVESPEQIYSGLRKEYPVQYWTNGNGKS